MEAGKRTVSVQENLIPGGVPRWVTRRASPPWRREPNNSRHADERLFLPSPSPRSGWAAQAAESTLCSQPHALPSPHTLFPRGKPEGGRTKGFFKFHVLLSATATNRIKTGPSLSLHSKPTTAEAPPVPVQLHVLYLCKQRPQLPIQPVTSNTGFS